MEKLSKKEADLKKKLHIIINKIKKVFNALEISKKRKDLLMEELLVLQKCFKKMGLLKSYSAIRAMQRYFIFGKNDKSYQYDKYYVDFSFIDMLIKKKIITGKTVLDLGCGNGWILEGFQRYKMKTFGIDLSPSFVMNSDPRLGMHIGLIDMQPENFRNTVLDKIWHSKYDAVITNLTMDRVRNQKQLLKNLIDLTKKNGKFVVGTLLPIVTNDDYSQKKFARTKSTKKIIVYSKSGITFGKKVEEDCEQLISYFEKELGQTVKVLSFRYREDVYLKDFHIFYGIKR